MLMLIAGVCKDKCCYLRPDFIDLHQSANTGTYINLLNVRLNHATLLV